MAHCVFERAGHVGNPGHGAVVVSLRLVATATCLLCCCGVLPSSVHASNLLQVTSCIARVCCCLGT